MTRARTRIRRRRRQRRALGIQLRSGVNPSPHNLPSGRTGRARKGRKPPKS